MVTLSDRQKPFQKDSDRAFSGVSQQGIYF